MSGSNINIKNGSNRTHININNNVNNRVTSHNKAKQVQATARKLTDKFGDDRSYNFFLKVAWRLSESRIWQHVETAMAATRGKPGDSPLKFFIYLCKVDGV